MKAQTIPWETVKEELLRDPEVRREYEALEPAYQIARLRILRGLTQEQLASLVGTKQPGIARLESGATEPTLPFLRKVAAALGSRLEIHFVPLAPEGVLAPERVLACPGGQARVPEGVLVEDTGDGQPAGNSSQSLNVL